VKKAQIGQKTSGLSSHAYAQLRAAIVRGDFHAGEALFEVRLADMLGMSRTPVREALQVLARDGFLESTPSRGYSVPRWSIDDVRELFELRETLEGAATHYATLRASAAAVAELEQLCEQYEQAGEFEAWTLIGTEFHNRIFAMGGNRRINTLLDSLKAQIMLTRRSVLAGVDGRREESVQEHRAILDAIRRRDADAAERLAREHVRLSYQATLRGFHLGR
jgi:DNA-binding GntR family transcriptional regulator